MKNFLCNSYTLWKIMFFIYGRWVCVLWMFYTIAICCFSSVDENEYFWADATLCWYGNDMVKDDDPSRFISVIPALYGLVLWKEQQPRCRDRKKMFLFPVMSTATESITYEILLLSRRHTRAISFTIESHNGAINTVCRYFARANHPKKKANEMPENH